LKTNGLYLSKTVVGVRRGQGESRGSRKKRGKSGRKKWGSCYHYALSLKKKDKVPGRPSPKNRPSAQVGANNKDKEKGFGAVKDLLDTKRGSASTMDEKESSPRWAN